MKTTNENQHWVDRYRTEIREYLLENYDKCWFDYHESYTIYINTDTGELSKKSSPWGAPRKPYGATNIEIITMRDKNMWAYVGADEVIHTQPIEYVKETLGLELPENWREYTYDERNEWVDKNVGEEKIRAYNLVLWEREIDLIIDSLSSYKK
ncbi:MAG TPA: hypothetical protein VL022_05715 [Moheibacter sp.]|nr:hypothetical protein [Moheibacter sp.]